MNLEDHVGDVLSKARNSAGVSLSAAANAAGLTQDELSGLEETGRVGKRINWAGLGQLLNLHAVKLEQLAEGWAPAAVDLDRWRELHQITTRNSRMQVNCYLAWDASTREAALFDTGFEAEPIFDLIAKHGLNLLHLFITHTHGDHVAALEPIRRKFPRMQVHTNSKNAPSEQRNRAGDSINVGTLCVTNRDTPGHAEDGVTYVIENWPDAAPAVAVVGDALFAGSMGGARELLGLAKQKVREQILSLPGSALICPGHGPVTTVEQEKAHNPFFLD